MKLGTICSPIGYEAVLLDDHGSYYRRTAELGVPGDMLALIESFDQSRSVLADSRSGHRTAVTAGCLVAPLPRPSRNVFCVGKNYREHAREFGQSGFDAGKVGGDEVPEAPIFFSKPPSSVVGPDVAIHSDSDPFDSVDYEGELAVIIGRRAQRVDRAGAAACVFGYTIINDVTAREVQRIHKQWLLGKGIDGFCPMGPWIVTADEMEPLAGKVLSTEVNGELRQRSTLDQLIFDVPSLIECLSRYITLVPGDVIATGTPAGVGIGLKPPKFLKRGDVVRISVEGLGTLTNPVV